jgi:hypothetical protein
MTFQFATCDPKRALTFIQRFYKVEESDIPCMLNLIKRDVLRVQDPDMHSRCEITAGKKYDTKFDADITEAVSELTKHARVD